MTYEIVNAGLSKSICCLSNVKLQLAHSPFILITWQENSQIIDLQSC